MADTTIRRFLIWFLVGFAAAALLQVAQSRVMGGVPEGLLFAGNWQEVHPIVVDELPRTPVFDGDGHDGQIFYAVALDLRGDWVPETLVSSPYRYRRILYPYLASGFGALNGSKLLWGMILLASLPVGVAAGATALLGSALHLPRWAPIVVVANPGMWLSARLLTADNLALALGMVGILAFVKRRDWIAVVALGAAALAKEPYLAITIGLVGFAWFAHERRRALRLIIGSSIPMLLWWGYIALAIGDPFDSGGNVVAPLTGLVTAVAAWPLQAPRDWFYLAATLIGLGASIWVLLQCSRFWKCLVAPWLLIASVSSHVVWQFGNNAIRAFAPILTLSILGLVASRLSSDQDRLTIPAEVTPTT